MFKCAVISGVKTPRNMSKLYILTSKHLHIADHDAADGVTYLEDGAERRDGEREEVVIGTLPTLPILSFYLYRRLNLIFA